MSCELDADGSLDYCPARRLFEVGWESLADTELLALLIGPGSPEKRALRKAYKLLESFGSARNLKQATYHELCRSGLHDRQALAVLAALELFRRIHQIALFPGQSFRTSVEIFRHFQFQFQGLKKECFWNVLLDGKNRILKIVRISEGSLTSSLVHPREVFRPAIREAAAGVLFVHNHPSGDPAPSSEDTQITRRLVETGKIVGIRVLDHVIIDARKYFSFADRGLL